MSVNERRAEIIRILIGIKRTTIPILAKTLNVSVSTIKRDLLALTVDEGYPIDTEQGRGGGIILRDFKHPHRHILSQEQIRVITEFAQNTDTYRAGVLYGVLNAYA